MSDRSKQIVSAILKQELHKAKTLITEAMNEKIGVILEEELANFGPTIFEAKKKQCDCGNKNCKCAENEKYEKSKK